jgi:hypothetical protein
MGEFSLNLVTLPRAHWRMCEHGTCMNTFMPVVVALFPTEKS